MSYFIVISLWSFFGLQHSYLARPFFKEKIKKYLGAVFEKYFYRFFYYLHVQKKIMRKLYFSKQTRK